MRAFQPARRTLYKVVYLTQGPHIDGTVGSLGFGRHLVPNHMHDSSCHAASCVCQERPTGVFARGPRLLFNPHTYTHTHTCAPPTRPHSRTHTHIHKNTLCPPKLYPPMHPPSQLPGPLPPSLPFRLHATLIINDLRDSFHLIYYLGRDSGCCAAASLLDL